MTPKTLNLLVGDNPFHGISHLSQARARLRSAEQQQENTRQATHLVELCLANGADGFMFSVDEATLAIIENLTRNPETPRCALYSLIPYAYEYVRKSTQTGGVAGLAKNLAKELLRSNKRDVIANMTGILGLNPTALLKTYAAYELSRLKTVVNETVYLKSLMLQELVTDMALALDMEGLFKAYIKFVEDRGIRAGFETRNFPYLVDKFREWDIDFNKLTLTASFNKVGFQMCPSKRECEEALNHVGNAEIIAMSVLAAGYLKPSEAISYVAGLEGISGVVLGVSKESHATETFRVFREGNPFPNAYA
jgi:hypothetical protein